MRWRWRGVRVVESNLLWIFIEGVFLSFLLHILGFFFFFFISNNSFIESVRRPYVH
jgi:hypothetical protein